VDQSVNRRLITKLIMTCFAQDYAYLILYRASYRSVTDMIGESLSTNVTQGENRNKNKCQVNFLSLQMTMKLTRVGRLQYESIAALCYTCINLMLSLWIFLYRITSRVNA